jgi:hypothetical protein
MYMYITCIYSLYMIYDVCHKCIKRQYLIVGTSKSGNGNHTEYILHGAWAEGIRLGDNIWLEAPVNQETVNIQRTYYTMCVTSVLGDNIWLVVQVNQKSVLFL